MPTHYDNDGANLVPTSDPNIWIGSYGQPIDIRSGYGSLGQPLISVATQEEIQIELRNLKINHLFL